MSYATLPMLVTQPVPTDNCAQSNTSANVNYPMRMRHQTGD